MSELKIGNKTGTETKNLIIDDEIITFITPKIEINDKMIYIKDDTTKSGIKEFATRHEAKKQAEKTLKELKERQRNNDWKKSKS